MSTGVFWMLQSIGLEMDIEESELEKTSWRYVQKSALPPGILRTYREMVRREMIFKFPNIGSCREMIKVLLHGMGVNWGELPGILHGVKSAIFT
ncbi:hypothetical protein JY97_02645 [Alkalispirochaeta odontotermitis]|nr:hypothetical protein JY97_02645 [Alkalispirochaeta odontotermitis]